MQYIIKTYKGIGDVKLGMSREDIHKVLGKGFKQISKTKGSVPSDAYGSEGMYVYYDRDGNCNAIEVTLPCRPSFDGIDFFEKSFQDIVDKLRKHDKDIQVNTDGFISLKLGIGGYCPVPNKNATIESIICFREGYYD